MEEFRCFAYVEGSMIRRVMLVSLHPLGSNLILTLRLETLCLPREKTEAEPEGSFEIKVWRREDRLNHCKCEL